MNILGTIYAIDEPHIEILKNELLTTPPPLGGLGVGTIICMDMDETDDKLEKAFPDHCQKATLLCPPPLAIYKEIDGDEEGFIQMYNEYLEYDTSVQEFIASMLLFLHIGGKIILYTPSYIEDNTIWFNTLLLFFYTRYGINIGTSASNHAFYDQKYDGVIADLLYRHHMISIFDYVNCSTSLLPAEDLYNQACFDLEPFTEVGHHPIETWNYMKNSILYCGIPICKPAVIFDK